jgi:hypothetical protein
MKIKTIQIIIFTLTAATVLLAFWVYLESGRDVSPDSAAAVLEAKISDEGGVQIKVEPQSLSSGSSWDFKITLDTHSVALDQDLLQNVKLVVDGKDTYSPTNWEGSPVGGHHRSGVLSFAARVVSPRALELQILDVGEVSKRLFQWELK